MILSRYARSKGMRDSAFGIRKAAASKLLQIPHHKSRISGSQAAFFAPISSPFLIASSMPPTM
jgi:hypothetical protein